MAVNDVLATVLKSFGMDTLSTTDNSEESASDINETSDDEIDTNDLDPHGYIAKVLQSTKTIVKIAEKVKFIDELFKIAYENISVIKKEKELNTLLKESLFNLKNDPIIINNGYLDKIKLWDYKFKQINTSFLSSYS